MQDKSLPQDSWMHTLGAIVECLDDDDYYGSDPDYQGSGGPIAVGTDGSKEDLSSECSDSHMNKDELEKMEGDHQQMASDLTKNTHFAKVFV